MINKFIRNFIAKQMAGRSDDGIMITLKDPQKVTLAENIMADLLIRNSIDPRIIKSEDELKMILQQIENARVRDIQNTGIRNTTSAKVFDLEGKEIPPGSKIMGGKKIDDDLPPPGSRGGDDDIAAPVMNVEDAPEGFIDFVRKRDPKAAEKFQEIENDIKAKIEAGNKRYLDKIKKQKEEGTYKRYNPEEGSQLDLEIKEEFQKAIRGESKLFAGKFEGTEDDFRNMLDEMTDDFASGGRVGLKEGSGMTRRTFLKLLGGAMSIPIIGKIFKPLKVGKTVTKVPIIKTDNVAGKPEWFDQLVNKVILEGDDVTKRFATKDREVVHMKVLEKGTTGKKFPPGTPGSDDTAVIVTQDLDAGAVRVEYRNTENMYGDPVELRYKKPNPDEGDPRPSAEFDVAESGPVGRAYGPDDYEIEIEELGGTSISDLTSDVSKLKEYATGKKPTLKEFVQSKKRKDKARKITEGGENEMDEVIRRQGEYIQYDDIDPEPLDFARGGIARMLGE